MTFEDWLQNEIEHNNHRLRRLRDSSPDWVMMLYRVAVLEECYRQFRRLGPTNFAAGLQAAHAEEAQA